MVDKYSGDNAGDYINENGKIYRRTFEEYKNKMIIVQIADISNAQSLNPNFDATKFAVGKFIKIALGNVNYDSNQSLLWNLTNFQNPLRDQLNILVSDKYCSLDNQKVTWDEVKNITVELNSTLVDDEDYLLGKTTFIPTTIFPVAYLYQLLNFLFDKI